MKNKRKKMKKIIKLSVAAALAATAMNAAVVDNVKLDGKARLFYETNDATGTMFSEDQGTKGQLRLTASASADVGPLKVNLRSNVLTTAGLEQAVVTGPQTATAETINYTDIANVSATVGGTTLVVGTQELNTPMCFTEGWNIHRNTFDANVVINKGLIPNTTLIYADVKSTNADGAGLNADGEQTSLLKGNAGSSASMIAASTTIAGQPLNVYFYDVDVNGVTAATVLWADTKVAGLINIIAAQRDDQAGQEGNAFAISGSTKVAGLNVFAAYSNVSDDGQNFMNVATAKKTKLPTQAVYVDGTIVAQSDAETVKIKVSGVEVAGVKLALQHVASENDAANTKNNETDLIATTKVAGIAVKALLMNIQKDSTPTQTNFRVYANYSF
jgi:hypothetical protein